MSGVLRHSIWPRSRRKVTPAEADSFIIGPKLHQRIEIKMCKLERMQSGDKDIPIFDYLNFGTNFISHFISLAAACQVSPTSQSSMTPH